MGGVDLVLRSPMLDRTSTVLRYPLLSAALYLLLTSERDHEQRSKDDECDTDGVCGVVMCCGMDSWRGQWSDGSSRHKLTLGDENEQSQ